jgi:hypothetical protein
MYVLVCVYTRYPKYYDWLRLPFSASSVPTIHQFLPVLWELESRLRRGECLFLYSREGHGRIGVVAAALVSTIIIINIIITVTVTVCMIYSSIVYIRTYILVCVNLLMYADTLVWLFCLLINLFILFHFIKFNLKKAWKAVRSDSKGSSLSNSSLSWCDS